MRFQSILAVIPLTLLSFAAAGELQIEKTHVIEDCTKRTAKGDTVEMHYRGTLAEDGTEFDASYNRNQPLGFKVGAGMVIKGYV